ncbi:hypothetical protein V500_03416 [Pseudogymnoascus sp. VKM F-4518 (FW-2643)]|nr:hypothetical protein V500_03416 [Pseudogymnoascus sp. VKM F-4518 (FW-2643)]
MADSSHPQEPPSDKQQQSKYGGFTRFEIELERKPPLPPPPRNPHNHLLLPRHPQPTAPQPPPLRRLPRLPPILLHRAISQVPDVPGADAQEPRVAPE